MMEDFEVAGLIDEIGREHFYPSVKLGGRRASARLQVEIRRDAQVLEPAVGGDGDDHGVMTEPSSEPVERR